MLALNDENHKKKMEMRYETVSFEFEISSIRAEGPVNTRLATFMFQKARRNHVGELAAA
jgi:hypothetical protein